jgi:prophage antirepressor-like protein
MTDIVGRDLVVTPFSFEGSQLRTVARDGEPWFVAADVCEALDIGNVTNALKRLDDDEQALYSIKGIHYGDDLVNVVNESGLYSLILGSRKLEAKRFKKWVTSTVLPEIRKTGSYIKPAMSVLEILTLAMESEKGRLVAIEQRDYAIATKALIGSKREATAMATASAAVRKAKHFSKNAGKNWREGL